MGLGVWGRVATDWVWEFGKELQSLLLVNIRLLLVIVLCEDSFSYSILLSSIIYLFYCMPWEKVIPFVSVNVCIF